MKKSIKKEIQPGRLIRAGKTFYTVVSLQERTFTCTYQYKGSTYEQNFYYNIDMEVYSLVASNIESSHDRRTKAILEPKT